jgi:hypothetical protein
MRKRIQKSAISAILVMALLLQGVPCVSAADDPTEGTAPVQTQLPAETAPVTQPPTETEPTEPESTIAETTEPEMPTAYDQETAATEEPEQEQNVPPVKEQPDSFVEQDAPEVQKTVWEMIVDWFVNLIDFIVGLFGGRH